MYKLATLLLSLTFLLSNVTVINYDIKLSERFRTVDGKQDSLKILQKYLSSTPDHVEITYDKESGRSGEHVKATVRVKDASDNLMKDFTGELKITTSANFSSELFHPSFFISAEDDAKLVNLSYGVKKVDDVDRGKIYNLRSFSITHIVPIVPYQLKASWTISAWFKNPSATYVGYLISSRRYLHEVHVAVLKGHFGAASANNTFLITSTFNFRDLMKGESANKWHHLIAVGKNDSTTFYLDGQYAGNIAFQGKVPVGAIGAHGSGYGKFADFLDAISIYDRAFTAEEVSDFEKIQAFPKDGRIRFTKNDEASKTISLAFDKLGKTSLTVSYQNTNIKTSENTFFVKPYSFTMELSEPILKVKKAFNLEIKARSVSGLYADQNLGDIKVALYSSKDKTNALERYDFSSDADGDYTFTNLVLESNGNQSLFLTSNYGTRDNLEIFLKSQPPAYVDLAFKEKLIKSGEAITVTTKVTDESGKLIKDFIGELKLMTSAGFVSTLYNPDFYITADKDVEPVRLLDDVNKVDDISRGKVYKFLADDSYIELRSPHPLKESWTISLWFKNMNTSRKWKNIVSSKGPKAHIIVNMDGLLGVTNSRVFATDPSFNLQDAVSGGNANKWHHLVAVGAGDSTKFYLNGKNVGTVPLKTEVAIEAIGHHYLTYARREGASRFAYVRFAQYMDDIAIYNRALSVKDILTLFNDRTNAFFDLGSIYFTKNDEGKKSILLAFDQLGKTSLTTSYENIKLSSNTNTIHISPYSFEISQPVLVMANRNFDLLVKAKSISGIDASQNIGKIIVTLRSSSDNGKVLGTHDFSSETGGNYTFSKLLLKTAGVHTLYLTSNFETRDSLAIHVESPPPRFEITFDKRRIKSGKSVKAIIKARDALGNLVNNFTGDVKLSTNAGFVYNLPKPQFFITADDDSKLVELKNNVAKVNDKDRGKVYDLSGNNSFIKLHTPYVLHKLPKRINNWTVSVWFKNLGMNGHWRFLITTRPLGSHIVLNDAGYLGALNALNTEHFTNFNLSDAINKESVDKWHHIAAVRVGYDVKYYIDGKYVGKVTYRIENSIEGIGNYSIYKSYKFARYLDDIAIYNRDFSNEEIAALYKDNKKILLKDRVLHFVKNEKGQKTISLAFELLGQTNLTLFYKDFKLNTNFTTNTILISPYSFALKLSKTVLKTNEAFGLNVKAKSVSGFEASQSLGDVQITLSSSKDSKTPIGSYNFSKGTNGDYTFKNIILKTVGTQSLLVSSANTRDSLVVDVELKKEKTSLNFEAKSFEATKLSTLEKGVEVKMAVFALSNIKGNTTVKWTSLRVWNDLKSNTALTDLDSVSLYRISGKDTTRLSRTVFVADKLGTYAEISIRDGIVVAKASDSFMITYRLASSFNSKNYIAIKIDEAAFTFSSNEIKISNLPYNLTVKLSKSSLKIATFEKGEYKEDGIMITLVTASESRNSDLYVLRENVKSEKVDTVKKISLGKAGVDRSFLDKTAEFDTDYRYYLEEYDVISNERHCPEDIKFTTKREKFEKVKKITIENAYPNPFNPNVRVKIDLVTKSRVELRVYNALGQLVNLSIVDMERGRGKKLSWNGKTNNGNRVSSGVYFLHINVNGLDGKIQKKRTQKIILIK